MTERRHHLVTASGFVQAVELTHRVLDARHALTSFDIGYEILNRQAATDEPALATDDVRWTATAMIEVPSKLRRRLGLRPKVERYTGTARIDAGGLHGRGIAYACVRLMEATGGQTLVLDRYPGLEPSR